MNVFLREMKAHRKSLIVWSALLLFMLVTGMAKFSALSTSSTANQSMSSLLDKMPRILKAVFGIGDFDLTTVIGQFAVMFFYLVIMATIHATMLGADILSKEERDRTSEFLFVKPVSRDSVVTSKLLAALANIVIFNLVTLVLSLIIVDSYSHGENLTGEILKLMLGMFVLQIIYMAIGLGIAAISKRPKSATGIATGILLVTFLLSIVIQMDERLDVLKFLTPFKYFEAKYILSTNGVEPAFIIISISLIILLLSVTYLAFRKRDLKV